MADNKLELIKKIREITDAPMLDCKKSLEESNWDLDKAIQWLNENKLKKAAKKSNRIAAEGIVKFVKNSKFAVLYELNSETDFVVQNQKFIELSKKIEEVLLANKFSNEAELLKLKTKDKKDLKLLCDEATGVIGEKIALRRAIQLPANKGLVTGYTHNNNKIAVIVIGEGKDETVLRNVGMQIAAMNPQYALVSDVPKKEIKKLEDEFKKDPTLANKPAQIQQKIVDGKINKELSEFVLEKQDFVMESGMKVEQYLAQHNTKLISFVRYELAEGVEKQVTNFADEVAAQMKK
ncbi:Elongation factor Ts [Mycoplasmopsis californica]|uniref:Elongation factor Ts n=1 Tax=Mycoplasmopsis equigenitalium TaxID=114883 RepID=A0ABY5J1G2_9BACT|nr:translation elongation factor Ts [Mycoplasmopsis equigenitalium]UUD37079.1 translation elongation factor Ts [Mycoplasmopsis equigenitalium]VEU69620.1 Elongation factor Ts [Mycoplasmopsis californica]